MAINLKTMKYLPGFVPIQFHKSGKILLVIAILLMLARGADYLFSWNAVSNVFLYVGIGVFIISIYLILAVPKEEEN